MWCRKCGTISTVKIDGYAVGDRVLEGVWFLCEITRKSVRNVRVNAGDAAYFNTLNTKLWLKEVKDYITDIVDNDDWDSFNCNTCGRDTVWPNQAAHDKEAKHV